MDILTRKCMLLAAYFLPREGHLEWLYLDLVEA